MSEGVRCLPPPAAAAAKITVSMLCARQLKFNSRQSGWTRRPELQCGGKSKLTLLIRLVRKNSRRKKRKTKCTL